MAVFVDMMTNNWTDTLKTLMSDINDNLDS